MALIALGIWAIASTSTLGVVVPLVIGASLVYLAISRSRVGTLVFDHACIVVGAYLITWGVLLLPNSEPDLVGILGRPLFWGIFSLMGGVCAIFHGFCKCVTRQSDQFEGIVSKSTRASV